MSAEGKKRRGRSGVSNAKSIAFRNGGNPCNLSTKTGSTRHPRLGGSKMLHAMILGASLPGFFASERLILAADATMDFLKMS